MPSSNGDIMLAHKQSIHHREQLESSELCGCFYCLNIYPQSEINTWIDNDSTAICPYCSIDSIIGSAFGHPITKVFLSDMCKYWFEKD